MHRRPRLPLALLGALGSLLVPASAAAESRLTIRGAGWGHGVGMSQYGAYGMALQGSTHREILAHYYTGTSLGELAPNRVVRVLLQGPRGLHRFTGATRAGSRPLSPNRTYGARRGPGGTVELVSVNGRRIKRFPSPLVVKGRQPVVLRGRALNGVASGAYRGSLEFRASGYVGITAINAVGIENYIRGVVARESPAGWPPAALEAQAIAARTYAVTTSKAGDGFEHYPDVRSQVYGGVSAEDPRTDAAVAATKGKLVTYQGQPVVTYFFSTSGGRTEDVENTPLGNEPKPWLKSVADPYDDKSPKHRWGPIRMSLARAGKKLGGLVKGSFRGIDVVRRGRSPRIVEADVVGSEGRTRVTGGTLRARLDLFDTWAYFTSITSGEEPSEREVDGGEPTPAPTPSPSPTPSPTGGTPPDARAAVLLGRAIAGRVVPSRPGAEVVVERRHGRRWDRAGVATVRSGGRYSFAVPSPGTYRVRYRGDAGPRVRIR